MARIMSSARHCATLTPAPPPLGLIPVGAHTAPGGPHACQDPLTVECDCDSLGFSWRACDGCGSALGGGRFALTVFEN
jgi:hypothetical protein